MNKQDAYNMLNGIVRTANKTRLAEALYVLHDTCGLCKDCAICPLETECSTMFNVIPRMWNVTAPTLTREGEEEW